MNRNRLLHFWPLQFKDKVQKRQLAGTDPCIANLTKLVPNARIPFENAAIQPTSTELEIARGIAVVASSYPMVMVAVEGHTDPSGNEVDNLLISWQRAEEISKKC